MRTSMKTLTNEQLLTNLRELARRERRLTLAVIDYLGEVEHRRIHLERGYSAMFYFCTREIGYSESAANRRIRAARCVRRFPGIRELLESRRLTMSVLCVVAADLTPDNSDRLLQSVCGKSTRQAIDLMAQLRPLRRARERIRSVAVLRIPPGDSLTGKGFFRATAANPPHASPQRPTPTPPRAPGPPEPPRPTAGGETPHPPAPVERKYAFEFAGSEAFLKKYQRVAALYSRRTTGRVTIVTVFEGVLDEYIRHNDPLMRIERRRNRKKVALHKQINSSGESVESQARGRSGRPNPAREQSRHIPVAVRDEVQCRDGDRCTYVSPDGKRCEAIQNLQVDHIEPHALGGSHELPNLRLLCAAHNRLVAEKIFGRKHMESFSRDK